MLVAYLDEFGHIGPFHPEITTGNRPRPAFGYAGFVIPVDNVREFGGFFEFIKEKLLAWEIEQSGCHPRRWEKKGSSLLTTENILKYGKKEIEPALKRLFTRLYRLDGEVVFCGMEKDHGETPNETATQRSTHMLINSVRCLADIAEARDEKIMIFLDAVDEAPRLEAVSQLGGFIYTASNPNLRRVVEVPMQLESKHYGNVQFADWICGLMGRLTDFHLAGREEFAWSAAMYNNLIHSKRGASAKSFVRTGRSGQKRSSIHSSDLTKDKAWSLSPTPNPKSSSSRRSSAPQRKKQGIAQTVGELNPELRSFYNSLTTKG